MNNQLNHYNKNALKGTFYIQGYDKYVKAAADMLDCDDRTAAAKITSGIMTHEDTLTLAAGLGLTVRQYLDIFCKDVFKADE